MVASVNQTNTSPISLEVFLHNAAISSQAIIDAIPDDVSVHDEANVIEAAVAPVHALAQLILQMSNKDDAARAVRSRAQAWLDGNYFASMEIAA